MLKFLIKFNAISINDVTFGIHEFGTPPCGITTMGVGPRFRLILPVTGVGEESALSAASTLIFFTGDQTD